MQYGGDGEGYVETMEKTGYIFANVSINDP